MDPITIIGTAGSVANIVDTLSKVIGKIREIHHQWKDAEFALMNLVSQLTALRAALNKIEDWMGSASPDDHYYQLEMDLDLALACCKTLVETLNDHISDLSTREDGSLAAMARIKVILGASKLDEIQKLVDRQIGALTLLLTACNCKSISEQKTQLEQKSTRKIMSVIEKDTASLFVHWDGNSSQSLSTDRGSQLSRIFAFDAQLWRSQVYEKVNRQLIKRTIRIQQSYQPRSSNKINNRDACSNAFGSNNAIPDSRIRPRADSANMQNPTSYRERRIVVLGARDAGKSTILRQMEMIYRGGHTPSERRLFVPAVHYSLADSAVTLVNSMHECKIEPEGFRNWAAYERIAECKQCTDLEPIAGIWADATVRKAVENGQLTGLQRPDIHLLDNASRITAPGYTPTEADLLMYNAQTAGISEVRFELDKLRICMVDVGGSRSEREKWSKAFQGGIDAMMFVVDLASYCQSAPEDPDVNGLLESLTVFAGLVNSSWFAKTPVFLIFNKLDEFESRFVTDPMGNYFESYAGGTEPRQGMQFLVNSFTRLNKNPTPIQYQFIRAIDADDVRNMCAKIEETLIQEG